MSVVNPFTGRELNIESRRFKDIEKTGVLDLTICLPIEQERLSPISKLKGKEDTLSKYLTRGDYDAAFDYKVQIG